jgi:hypothetical protein
MRSVILWSAGGVIVASLAIALGIYGEGDDHKGVESDAPLVSELPSPNHSHRNPKPLLPPEAMPLIAIAPGLIKAADTGSSDAAVRLFRDLGICIANKREAEFFEQLQSDPDWKKSPDAYLARFNLRTEEEKEKALASITEKIDRVEAYRNMCEGADEYFENGKIYKALEAAAQLGDTQAIACMIAARYEGPPLSDRDAANYRETAYRLGDQAVTRGSWTVVQALAEAHSRELNVAGYSAYVQQPDPKLQLQYTELLLKGVSSGSPGHSVMQQMVKTLSENLNPTDRAQAEEWADNTFKNYFFFKGEADPNSSLCQQ